MLEHGRAECKPDLLKIIHRLQLYATVEPVILPFDMQQKNQCCGRKMLRARTTRARGASPY